MNELVREQMFVDHIRQTDFFEDWHALDNTAKWTFTDVAGSSGVTIALGVTGHSTAVMTTAAADDKEGLLASNTKFDLWTGLPLLWEGRSTAPEANTNAANYFHGVCSTKTTTTLSAAGAGMVASFSGFGFYKVDGGTYWKFVSSVATTRYGDNTTKSLSLNAGFTSFRVEVRPISSTECEIVPLLDLSGGTNYSQCKDYTTGTLIKHILTYTSFAPSCVMHVIRSGSASAEAVAVDYSRLSQRR